MEVCTVCADHATGRHYGAATCEGCKLFFKRSVKKDLSYTCRIAGCCPINKRYRNNCQFCRMKRCLAVGMRKEAVQQTKAHERKRRRTRKQPGLEFNKRSDFDTLSELITFLQNAEPYHQSSSKTEEHTLSNNEENLSETSARLLFMTVHWAKNVAHFSDLCYNDQVSLLKANWVLVFVLNLAQWTWTTDDRRRQKLSFELASTAKHSCLNTQVRKLEVILKKILDLEMDDAEYVLLKTLALFSPDTENLMEPAQVQTLQTKTQRALEEYILSRYNDKANRQGQILIKLFLLRTIDSGVIEQLFFMDMIGQASIQTLVEDILRTNTLHPENKLQM